MLEFDQDGNGTLSFEEFLVLFTSSQNFAFNQAQFKVDGQTRLMPEDVREVMLCIGLCSAAPQ